MAEFQLHSETRDKTGSQSAKAIRNSGKIPAIYYSHDVKPVYIVLDAKEFYPLLHQEVNIIKMILPDKSEANCIVREIQRDPLSEDVLHVDFMGIKLDEKVKLSIPIILTGTPAGVKEGGILEHLLREVEVEGLPLEIPEHLEVDVSDLMIGDVVTLEDIQVDKVRIVTEIHHAIANVIVPKIVQVEEPVEEEELEEGEVEGEKEEGAAPEEKESESKEE